VPRGAGVTYFQATNIGRARLLGVEAELRASAFGFEARASETALATRNEAHDACLAKTGICERPPLPGRPSHDFVLDLAYSRGPVRVRYGVDLVTGIRFGNGLTDTVPSRVLHSAGIRLAVPGAPGLSLALDVRNLFDLRVAPYQGVLGLPHY